MRHKSLGIVMVTLAVVLASLLPAPAFAQSVGVSPSSTIGVVRANEDGSQSPMSPYERRSASR